MKVATLRDFRDRATTMLRSRDLVLITRDGLPAGFFVPWDQPELPDDVKRGIYMALSQRARREMKTKRVTEQQVLADFRAARRARR
jgi:hypothetical protein